MISSPRSFWETFADTEVFAFLHGRLMLIDYHAIVMHVACVAQKQYGVVLCCTVYYSQPEAA